MESITHTDTAPTADADGAAILAHLRADTAEAEALRAAMGGWDDLEWQRWIAWVVERRATRRDADELRRALKKCAAQMADSPPPSRAATVGKALEDAPAAAGVMVPTGYSLDDGGVARWVQRFDAWDLVAVVGHPVYIGARLVAPGSHTTPERWRLHYRDGERWRETVAERSTCQTARALVTLADRGLSVSSTNAGDVVRYLQAMADTGSVPEAEAVDAMGWTPAGLVVGPILYPTDGSEPRPVAWAGYPQREAAVAACVATGDPERWRRDVLDVVCEFPPVAVVLVAGMASPVLRLVGASPFNVSLAGITSSGKTTAARVAASAWGCPDDTAPASYMATMDNTLTALERFAATCGNLPAIVDETQRARGDRAVVDFLYMLAQGQGRGRATPGGLQTTAHWRTVAILTGEQSVFDFGNDRGARGRTLELDGSPWGGDAPEAVARVSDAMRSTWGHAGYNWARVLVREGMADHLRSAVDDYRGMLDELVRQRLPDAGDAAGVVGRLVGHGAVLMATARTLRDELGWPLPIGGAAEPMAELIVGAILRSASAVDTPGAALDVVRAWLASQSARVWPGEGAHPPSQGWIAYRLDGAVAIVPNELRRFLDGAGYRPAEIIKAWAGRGWLDVDAERTDKKVSAAGERIRAIVLRPGIGED